VTLLGNERHPRIADDMARSSRVLTSLKPDSLFSDIATRLRW